MIASGSGPKKNQFLKPSLKPQRNFFLKFLFTFLKDRLLAPKTVKFSRYPNYLKSGITRTDNCVAKSTAPSSTISKKEYLRLNGLENETKENDGPLCKYGGSESTSDKQEMLHPASDDGKGTSALCLSSHYSTGSNTKIFTNSFSYLEFFISDLSKLNMLNKPIIRSQ